MTEAPLIVATEIGLYCPAGDFHIDPWAPVDRAVVTHAHSDHAGFGSKRYMTAARGAGLLRLRVGDEGEITPLAFGQRVVHNGVTLSLHPAGHILGSAQVRLEHRGRVEVFSGDYKTASDDQTCDAFEPLRCDVFITEATFALPVYQWRPQAILYREINDWWRRNLERGLTTIIFAYALGKAQRVLAGLDPQIGPIAAHGAVRRLLPAYRDAGVALPHVETITPDNLKQLRGKALVLAPPSAAGTTWLRKLGPLSTAFVSGWMQLRGTRRRRNVSRGFALSDHADWPGLLSAIRATGAPHIGVTHGYTAPLARWLRENGWDARVYATRYGDEEEIEAFSAADAREADPKLW